MDYQKFLQLNSVGGAAIGVALTHYALGKLGYLETVIKWIPTGNFALMAVDGAGGAAIMVAVGGVEVDANTLIVAGGTAIAMNMILNMLPQNLQDTLSGKN